MTTYAWLLGLTLGSTVVLAVALGLGALLGGTSAVARHRLWTITACGLLLLPALPVVLPRWEVRLVPKATEWARPQTEVVPPVRPSEDATLKFAHVVEAGRVEDVARPDSFATRLGTAALPVWLLGVLASLVGLGRALARERRVLAASRPLAGPWLDSMIEARRSLAVTRAVRLVASDEIQTPLTGGWRRPAVLLPASAALWSDERRRVVVQHELVHVLRADALRHLAWRLVVALYWFHPLVRLAQRQANVVGEQACDEAVLELGTRPSVYARHLLEIAESLRTQPHAFASALPMVDRSQLERRLLMILDPHRSARRGRASAAVCFALLAGTVLGVGAAMPVPFAPWSGAAAADPKPAEPARTKVLPETGLSACLEGRSGSFSGHLRDEDSGTNLSTGHNGDFVLQHSFGGGRRLCARVQGPVRLDERDGSIRELSPGASVLVETRAGRTRSQRMLVTSEQGERRYEWWVDGAAKDPDDAARAWLADALEVIAAHRAIGTLQGQVGALQGEIGSIQGEVGSLQGEIGSVQGQIGSLQGRIGSIQGEQGTLHGAIGRHQGAIGGLQGSRGGASDTQQAKIDQQIKEHEAAIRKLEAELEHGDISSRMAAAEEELRTFEQEAQGRIGDLEQHIKDVRAEERMAGLERQIEDLHVDDRIRDIEQRMKPALERLKSDMDRLGR